MRLVDFFQDGDGRMSMTRLMVFLSFWPASYIAVMDGSSETLGWYLSAYVVTYGAGKWADAFGKGNGNVANSTEILETSSVSVTSRDHLDARPPNSKTSLRKGKPRAF